VNHVLSFRELKLTVHEVADEWRNRDLIAPVYAGRRGHREIIIAPIDLWHRLVMRAAQGWDVTTSASRTRRMMNPAGAAATTLRELSALLDFDSKLKLHPKRGVPQGGQDLAIWAAALDDLMTIRAESPDAVGPAIGLLAAVLMGKSEAGESVIPGVWYAVEDIDGMSAAVLSWRVRAQPTSRLHHDVVELLSAGILRWDS
jgi:hypothetical protein